MEWIMFAIRKIGGFVMYGVKGCSEVERLRAMNEALQDALLQKDRPAIKAGGNITIAGGDVNFVLPDIEKPSIYDPHDRTVYFGTSHGDLSVRFHDAETIQEDISAWLSKTGQQRSVSYGRVKAVIQGVISRLRNGSNHQS